jgi:hypothetical protein
LTNLGPASSAACTSPSETSACIIDYTLSNSGTLAKSGYKFTAVASGGTPKDQFTVDATPATLNTTGVKEFCAVEDNVVRFKTPSDASLSTHDTCAATTAIGN